MVSRLVGVSFQKLLVKEEGEGLSSLSRLGEEGSQGDWIITPVIPSIWAVSFPFGPNVPKGWNAPIWQGFLLCWPGNPHTIITAGYGRFQELRNCFWHGGKHLHVLASGMRHFLCKWSRPTPSPFYLVIEAYFPPWHSSAHSMSRICQFSVFTHYHVTSMKSPGLSGFVHKCVYGARHLVGVSSIFSE